MSNYLPECRMLTNQLGDYSNVSLPSLHKAAAQGDAELTLQLLNAGNSVHELDRYMGASPLHYAAQGGNIAVVKIILAYGAHLNLQCATHGMTPLMIAVWHRHIALVEYLLTLPDINSEVIATVGVKAQDIIGFGVQGDGNESDQSESLKMHALFENAIMRQKKNPIFDVLLDKTTNEQKKLTLLQKIFQSNNDYKFINATLPINSSGNDAHTPLLIAARDGLADVVKLLLENGADQTIVDYYMRSLPIHKAAYSGHHAVIKNLVNNSKISEVLNAQGPFNGYTPLHDAVWHGHYKSACVLIEAGAKTNLKGYDGNTPADLARRHNYKDILNLLL